MEVSTILIGVVLVVAFVLIISIIAKMYRKSSKEMSFVRTGAGGEKVVSNGGAFVLSVFHDVIDINMRTLRLVVTRTQKQALITRDKIRVDVEAEFYLRVKQDSEAISIAAQTLGARTQNPDSLKELIEGKFVDALRSVSAEMGMNELHEQRADFVQKVQNALAGDLEKNGLELESVSLTGLDQTNVEHFDPNNAFDAQGLTKITKTIEDNKKMQNDLKQKTTVEIAEMDLDTKKKLLDIKKDEEMAQLSQLEDIANQQAMQEAQISLTQSEQKRIAEEARILSEKQVEEANIEKNLVIQEAQLSKDITISEKQKEKEIAEGQVKEIQIETTRKISEAEIEKNKSIEEAQIASDIVLAEKSQEHSRAETLKSEEYARAVIAEEKVITAREVEQAERLKNIALIKASESAEQDALEVTISAKAKADAAKLEAEAIEMLASAEEKKYEIDAEGARKINEAENSVSDEQVNLKIKLALINALPQIISETVKPMENIESMKIMDIKGLDGFGGSGSAGTSGGSGNLSQDLVSSALRYKAQIPLLEDLMKEIGLNGSSISDLSSILQKNETVDTKNPVSSEE